MKKILLSILLIFTITVINAQLKIGPSIGLNQSYVYAAPNNIRFDVENIFKPNLTLGLRTEYKFNRTFELVLQTNYFKRSMRAIDSGWFPMNGVRYNALTNSLFLNTNIFKGLRLGAGLNHLYLPKIRAIYGSDDNIYLYSNRHDWGFITSVNYNYKNFILDFNYCYTFHSNELHTNYVIEPISFIQLQLAYVFPINLFQKRRKEN